MSKKKEIVKLNTFRNFNIGVVIFFIIVYNRNIIFIALIRIVINLKNFLSFWRLDVRC